MAGGKDISYDTYNRPYKKLGRAAGECVRCTGTGFEPDVIGHLCDECSGTGICPQCDGRHSREWHELPSDAKAQYLEHWELYGNFPKDYLSLASLYRNW